MILKRIYNEALAHASYIVGCAASGEAVVIDANRDVDQYVDLAAAEGLKIVAVTETHIHADYLSGSRELAHRTGARLYLSDEGTADWKYGFASDPNVELIRHGDSIRIGAIRFDVVKTAGHTPEHISFLVTDEASCPDPLGLFSGDFIFVGDVGRPDLLENAAGLLGTAEPGARDLYASIQSVLAFPPHLLIWPAHGSGSACGKSLGGVPVSSLGYEKRANWALREANESRFVQKVLDGQPDPPKYFAQMKHLNKLGPRILGGMRVPPRLTTLPAGAILVDTRPSEEYLAGHIAGALHLPLGKSFINWAGWLLPYDRDVVLLANDENAAEQATRDLSLIGLDRVVGWSGPDLLEKQPLERIDQIFARELEEARNGSIVLDVRSIDEWREGHIPGATHIPLGRLNERSGELAPGKRIFVHCQGGVRSPIAASVLEKLGYFDVVNIKDGYSGFAAI